MIDNIKNLGTAAQFKTQDGAKRDIVEKTGAGTDTSETSALAPDNSGVHLSDDALKLEGIKKAILSAPDIDQAKVDRIKGEIARGEYKVGFENLAKRMIDGFAK